jgi:hypothetical protein
VEKKSKSAWRDGNFEPADDAVKIQSCAKLMAGHARENCAGAASRMRINPSISPSAGAIVLHSQDGAPILSGSSAIRL